MKRPKRPSESKSSRVFQTSSSPTDSTGIDLSYSYRALGGVGSTSQSSRVQDGGKSRHADVVQAMCKVRDRQGVWYGLPQDATRSRWRVLSMQRREPNDESNPTAAIDRHDFHQCSEIFLMMC